MDQLIIIGSTFLINPLAPCSVTHAHQLLFAAAQILLQPTHYSTHVMQPYYD